MAARWVCSPDRICSVTLLTELSGFAEDLSVEAYVPGGYLP